MEIVCLTAMQHLNDIELELDPTVMRCRDCAT